MTYTPGPGGGIQGGKIDFNPMFGQIGGYLQDRYEDAIGTSDRSKRIRKKTQQKLQTPYDHRPGAGALPGLRPGDDIPAAQYPEGVRTGTGGGNAGQAQSVNSEEEAYIPPTPKVEPETDSDGSGRDTSRTSSTGVQQKGTQMGPRIATYDELTALAGGEVKDMFAFHSQALPTTPPGDAKIDPNNYLVNGKPTSVDNMSEEDAFSMAHTQGKTSEFLKGYSGESGDVTALLDYAKNNGWKKTGMTPEEQAPETFESATEKFGAFYKDNAGKGDSPKKSDAPKVVKGVNGTEFGGDYGETYSTGRSAEEELARAAFLSDEGHIMDRYKRLEASRGIVHTHAGKFARKGDGFVKLNEKGVKAFKYGTQKPGEMDSYIDTDWGKPLTGKSAGGNTKPGEDTANPSGVQQADFDKAVQDFAGGKIEQVKAAIKAESGQGGTKREGPAGLFQEDWSRANTAPKEVVEMYNNNKSSFDEETKKFGEYFNQ